MAFILRPNTPTIANTPSLAEGDIWIRPAGTRAQYLSGVWVEMAVDPGFVAPGGNLPQRLAKTGAAFGQTAWGDPAEALVYMHTQTTPAAVWTVEHRLVSRLVHVLVVDPARNDMVMIPEIEFTHTQSCDLKFASAVSGVALVRR
jgi:hypothetical protein